MTLQEKLQELFEVKVMIESKLFQEYFCQPLRDKQGKLKVNFFSDSLKDSWRKGGRHEGIQEFFEILKQIDTDIKNTKYEMDKDN